MSGEHIKSLEKIRSNLYGNLKNNQQNGFVDCCKEFKFNLEIETKDFNDTMNTLGLVNILTYDGNPKEKGDYGYNLTDMFGRDVVNFVKIGTNMILGIIGNVGSGKSELAMLISLLCMKANRNYRKREVKHHLCWKMKDVSNVFPILKKGDVVMKDEMPKTTRKGSRTQEWEVNNVLRVIRAFQNTFIFVDPLDIKVDICNLYFESAGMDKKNRENRFLVLNKYRRYIGHIYVKLHEDEEFRNNYLKEKDKFIQRSLKRKGFSSAIINDADVELDNDKNDTNKESNEQKKQSKISISNFPVRSIEYLRKHLKETKNEITTYEYSKIMKVSIEIARRDLNKFVEKKEFDYVMRGKTKVYYSRK